MPLWERICLCFDHSMLGKSSYWSKLTPPWDILQVTGYVGDEQIAEALTGCDLVIIPAGVPRKPGANCFQADG